MGRIDDLVISRLIETLFDMVDAGQIDENSPEFDYWHDRLIKGDSRLS